MKNVILSGFLLISSVAHAQNPFAQGLDELAPPAGRPVCDAWYREQALPKIGCTSDLIDRICSGQLPKVYAGPDCGHLAAHAAGTGKTCHTQPWVGDCPLNQYAPLGAPCYCADIAKRQYSGNVSPP